MIEVGKLSHFKMLVSNEVREAVRDGRSEFDEALKHAQDAGFTTVRFFAHGSLRGDALQTSPGVYNE